MNTAGALSMHIWNDPSFFLTNRTGAPHGEETRPYNAFVRQLLQLFRQVFHSGRRPSIRCPCYGCSTRETNDVSRILGLGFGIR
nr:hypothetical protein [Tanacetum cinerariifolium]